MRIPIRFSIFFSARKQQSAQNYYESCVQWHGISWAKFPGKTIELCRIWQFLEQRSRRKINREFITRGLNFTGSQDIMLVEGEILTQSPGMKKLNNWEQEEFLQEFLTSLLDIMN